MVFNKFDERYRQCSVSVMDNIADPDIKFDEKGICNYYYEYQDAISTFLNKGNSELEQIDEIIEQIKKDGIGRQYDCALGVSGGTDSTYLAYYLKKAGLRVLCVHFDNGWDSELSISNIENIVNICGFDLFTYVVDWSEFRDIQLSYFKANVIDIEAITDIGIMTTLDNVCYKKNIKHLILGLNVVTEITIPRPWMCKNVANLKDIHKKNGNISLKTFPIMSPIKRRIIARIKPFKRWLLLNYLPYNIDEARKIISEKLNWQDYGGKHYESVFTRFYQGYILPHKFNVDKRKAHLSNLIFSGQMTKVEALKELDKPIYNKDLVKSDYEFVLKKLGFTQQEFEAYLEAPAVPHTNYEMSISIFDEISYLKPFRRIFNK